ncbi:hypothetical protein, partial [Pollutimonas bauzanensis]|uniref:hypothetical protein n=1 Tax=Pollutimonas bauzanensis TaxID=658167 RepID=UPI0033413FDB
TGTPGNARGVAREAETAPDTPAFLKNEKPSRPRPHSNATLAPRQVRRPRLRPLGALALPQAL